MRKLSGIAAIVSLLISSTSLSAQIGTTTRLKKKAPRAVAVMDFDNAGHPRILPVSLFMDGKFYDAGMYMSKPAPVTLASETVYEVLKSGVPQGLFTVDSARRSDKSWWGEGTWKPYGSSTDDSKKEDAKSSKPKFKEDEDSDRPVLKRHPEADKAEPAKSTAKDGKADVAVPSPDKQASVEPPVDPDRPTLRRVKPVAKSSPDEPIKFVTKLPGTENFSAAVSDEDPPNGRPYVYTWDERDKTRLTQEIKELAAAELRRVSAARSLSLPPLVKVAESKPTAKTKAARLSQSALPKTPQPDPLVNALTNVKIAAYDLDYNNSPQIVLTARYMPSAQAEDGSFNSKRGVSVTVVGRVNFENELQRVFASVSDPKQLDVHPEYAFIDAVDVDGDGRAELLFQRLTADARNFVIYRVIGAAMDEVFETAPR